MGLSLEDRVRAIKNIGRLAEENEGIFISPEKLLVGDETPALDDEVWGWAARIGYKMFSRAGDQMAEHLFFNQPVEAMQSIELTDSIMKKFHLSTD